MHSGILSLWQFGGVESLGSSSAASAWRRGREETKVATDHLFPLPPSPFHTVWGSNQELFSLYSVLATIL